MFRRLAALAGLTFGLTLPGEGGAAPTPAALPDSIVTLREKPAEPAAHSRWDRELQRRQDMARDRPGKAPSAILTLLGLLEELEGETAPEKVEAFLHAMADDRGRHPLVRSYARYLNARLVESRGDHDHAGAMMRAEGYLLSWQIVGPFDNTNRRGETAVYGPETEPYDANQSFSGKLAGEPLPWRPRDHESIPRGAYVSFDDLLRPNEDATGYATSWIKVERDTAAALHIGSGGPLQVWIDGELVGESSGYRISHPLQESYPVVLTAGWHRVLVKVSVLERMWGFHARLSAPSGAPLTGLETRPVQPAEPMAASASKAPSKPNDVASLRTELERAHSAGRAGSRARAGVDLVDFYRNVRPFDFDDATEAQLARSVDDEVKSARSAWLRAILERDPSESMRALRSAVERARTGAPERGGPALGPMLLELGWRERSLGLEDEYRARLYEARAAAPDDAVIEMQLLDEMAGEGFAWTSLHWLRDVVRRNPHADTLGVELASRLRSQGRSQEALSMLLALSAHSSDAGVVSQTIDTLLDLGRADEATELALRLADVSPGLAEVHLRVAKLEEARGRHDAAKAAWVRALTLVPHDAELHAEFGRVLARLGDRSAAATSLERSLELRPQQPLVRDLLAALKTKSATDMFARYGLDLEKIAAVVVPAKWKGKDAGVLHHRFAVKVLPNGLTERLDHRIIRILDDRGIRSQAVQATVFDPAESFVEVRRARVRRASGAIEELGEVQVLALASAGYRMYYDQRQVQVVFSGLRVGDTIEVAFLERDVAPQNMFEDYFGDLVPLQGGEPRRRVEYLLEAPQNKPIYFNLPGVKTQQRGKNILYEYVATDVPAIKPEGNMPGWTEIARYLHASTYKTWDDVGRWYWGLVREQLVVDDDIREAVRTATAKLPENASESDKVAAIYTYVVRNTRYVGLEFGIHGYKPYRTTEVFDRQFGDCKDKASLLKVMLAEVGVKSHLVLVRTSDQGAIPEQPASLSVFNHAITYVPSLDRFLDGTAEWAGPTEVPAQDQGASVLIVRDGEGATFRTIPMSSAADNLRATKQTITLTNTGGARVEHEMEVHGAAAASVRFRFAVEQEREERLRAAFGDLYAGVEVERTAAPGIADIGVVPRLQAELKVPQWAKPTPTGLRFRVLGRPSTLTAGLAGATKREQDLVLDGPSTERNELHYRLPRGYRFSRVPDSATIESPVGRFELAVTPTDDGVDVKSELTLPRHRIDASEYPSFREFLRSVDAKLEQDFEIAHDQ